MSKKDTDSNESEWSHWSKGGKWGGYGYRKGFSHPGGGMYGLGFLGALIYYLQHATTFWMGIVGIVKAIFWPAFLVYHLMLWLKM